MAAPLVLAPIVAMILAWISRIMMIKAGIWVIGALAYIGLYFGTQSFVVDPLIDQVRAIAEGSTTGAMAEWVAFLNVDRAITMILSAYVTAGGINATKVALFRR